MAGTGLVAIDHVALGLATDELDTWVLFCRSVLGLDASVHHIAQLRRHL